MVEKMATAKEILAVARKEIGVKESPAGSNNVKYNTAYYGQEVWDGKAGGKYPWCVAFLWWVFHQAEADGLFYGGKKTASCSVLMSYAQAHGQWVTSGYRAGDIVIMDFPGNKARTDHCGIVLTALTDGVRTIEGNTGVGNDSNGGEVMERTRPLSVIIGAYRPHYAEETAKKEDEEEMDIEKLTDEQLIRLAERMQAALAKRPISAALAAEVEQAKTMGITDGQGPNKLCTRAQAAAMIVRAVNRT